MTARYDFYKNPSPKGSKQRVRYHARVVPYGTTDSDTLAKLIHSRCTVTPADVKAVLSSLSDVIVNELQNGNRVYIEGLGYLQLTLECPPVQSVREVRAESIRFKSVAFRPEADLKKRLRATRFERASHKSHSKELSSDRIEEILVSYFTNHPYLTRHAFQGLCGYTRSTANRRLKELREAGKLSCIGAARTSLYVPGVNLQVNGQGSQEITE